MCFAWSYLDTQFLDTTHRISLMHCQMQRGLKVFNTPRQHGRSEDSSIENTIILEDKVKKKTEEMWRRRIDLHRSTVDYKFPDTKIFLNIWPRIGETGGKSHQCVLTLQLCWYNRKTGRPVTRGKPSEKNASSRLEMQRSEFKVKCWYLTEYALRIRDFTIRSIVFLCHL